MRITSYTLALDKILRKGQANISHHESPRISKTHFSQTIVQFSKALKEYNEFIKLKVICRLSKTKPNDNILRSPNIGC